MRLLVLVTAVLIGGCQQESSACDYLKDGYRPLEGRLTTLPIYPLEQVPEAVVGDIQRCWAAKPYGGPQHSIMLKDARQLSPTTYYLLFEPWGITDTMLVFLVDQQRGIVEAHQYGTL